MIDFIFNQNLFKSHFNMSSYNCDFCVSVVPSVSVLFFTDTIPF